MLFSRSNWGRRSGSGRMRQRSISPTAAGKPRWCLPGARPDEAPARGSPQFHEIARCPDSSRSRFRAEAIAPPVLPRQTIFPPRLSISHTSCPSAVGMTSTAKAGASAEINRRIKSRLVCFTRMDSGAGGSSLARAAITGVQARTIARRRRRAVHRSFLVAMTASRGGCTRSRFWCVGRLKSEAARKAKAKVGNRRSDGRPLLIRGGLCVYPVFVRTSRIAGWRRSPPV